MPMSSDSAMNFFISSLVVSTQRFARAFADKFGLFLLNCVAYRLVCVTSISKKSFVKKRLKKSPAVASFGSWTCIPALAVNSGMVVLGQKRLAAGKGGRDVCKYGGLMR